MVSIELQLNFTLCHKDHTCACEPEIFEAVKYRTKLFSANLDFLESLQNKFWNEYEPSCMHTVNRIEDL